MKLIFKFIKSLLTILILSSLIVFIVTWASLSAEKRYFLVQKLDEVLPFSIIELSNTLRAALPVEIQNLLQDGFAELDKENLNESTPLFSELLSESSSENSHFYLPEIDCSLPETKPLKKVTQEKIYQWKDENGRIHFSDSQDKLEAQDISQQYQSRKHFITVNIQPINSALPLDLTNNIHLSNSKMFLILSDALKIEQLHQLEISLKLFGEVEEYQVYLHQKAPNLKNAVGFYLANENEAGVLMQNNPEQNLAIIRHESSHVMMANLYGLSPLWLNEGFAEYFRNLKISGLETSIYPDYSHMKILKLSNNLSLKRHFELTVQEWQSQNVLQHYAEAWSIVYFLLSQPQNKRILSQYLSKLSVDRCLIPDAAEFFEQTYPGGLEVMDKDWKSWLAQNEIHPHRY